MMLVPNIWVHHVFGKLLFAASDLFLAQVIDKVLLLKGCRYSEWWACTWLFHPLAVIISSRGNADSLICLMVVQTALHLEQHNWMLAGVWFGLSVHFKIFPIVFAPSILLFIGHSMKKDTRVWWLKSVKERIVFTIFSAGIFLGLGVLFYIVYGWIFVYEGYLYHLIRKDHRHNFSVYFYSLYLEYGSTNTWSSVVAFFPQLIVQICFSASFYQDIILCMCLQTLAFVCFNKVSTAQYFIWYISLLPLVLPFSNIKIKWTGAILIVLWIASELNWLYWAYLLEFEGQNTFIQVWISSIVFFLVNGFLLCLLIKNQL